MNLAVIKMKTSRSAHLDSFDDEGVDSDDDDYIDDDDDHKSFNIIAGLIFNHWQELLTFAQSLARELDQCRYLK